MHECYLVICAVWFVGFRDGEARCWGQSGTAHTSPHSKHLSGWRLHLHGGHQTGLMELYKIVDMRHQVILLLEISEHRFSNAFFH